MTGRTHDPIAASISLVLPTSDRADALRENLDSMLAIREVDEVIVVDDGSRDDTPALLAAVRDSRVRVVRHPRRLGTPAARNSGVAAASSEWVLFGEDDCSFPPDYAAVLREEAEAHGAGIVGAPMIWVSRDGELDAEVARARECRRGAGALDEVAGFPATATPTPFLPAPVLARRSLLERLRFDEGFRGNAYREETDLFVRAARVGVVCLLTPRTFFWERRRFGGGNVRSPLVTELWTVRNNGRFLRRHGAWLSARGIVRSAVHEQLAFVGRRARRLVGAATAR